MRTMSAVAAMLLWAISMAPAEAQDAEAPAARTLAPVAVEGVRHPQEFDYSEGLRLTERFERIPASQRDRIRLAFYAQSKSDAIDPAKVQLDVITPDGDRDAEVLPSGRVILPEVPEPQAKDAKVVANVARGMLSIIYKVDLVPPANGLMTLGDLRESAVQARTGWKAVYNKMAAMTVPVFTCAEFEFDSPQAVTMTLGEQPLWTSEAARKVRVPFETPDASADAVIRFPLDRLVRIGGCKWKGVE